MDGKPMRNWTTNQVDLMIQQRAKPFFVVIAVLFMLCIQSCSWANNQIGQLVNTKDIPFYSKPNSSKTYTFSASPAIVIGSENGWQQLIAVNGQVGWVKNPISAIGETFVEARGDSLDVTTLPISQKGSPEYKWTTITSPENGKILSASSQKYNHTPDYIADHGRSNLIPENKSPYKWPELQLQFQDKKGWARIVDLEFHQRTPVNGIVYSGIVMRPFISLLPRDFQNITPPPPDATFINLSQNSKDIVKLPPIKWQMGAFILWPQEPGNQLKYIAFYSSSSQESYALALHWQNGEVQYLTYTGWLNGTMETIATPMILNFSIVNGNMGSGKVIQLDIGQISGDDYSIERLSIDSHYTTDMPNIKIESVR